MDKPLNAALCIQMEGIVDEKIAWPNQYEKLFIDGGNYYEFSHIAWGNLETQIAGYRMGYKAAADNLIEDALSSKDISKLDTFVFPAIFLYRHYIELTLKDLIITLADLNREEKIQMLKKYSHNLDVLWKDFVKVSLDITGEANDVALNTVGKYVQEFHCIDKGSVSFRYPFTKELELIFGNEKRINLRHLKERMEEIEMFFVGAGNYMYDLKRASE